MLSLFIIHQFKTQTDPNTENTRSIICNFIPVNLPKNTYNNMQLYQNPVSSLRIQFFSNGSQMKKQFACALAFLLIATCTMTYSPYLMNQQIKYTTKYQLQLQKVKTTRDLNA